MTGGSVLTGSTGSAASAAEPTRRFLLARLFLPVWIVVAGAAVASAVGASPPVEVGFALVLASLLVVGLPHGAVDHLFVRRLLRLRTDSDDRQRQSSGFDRFLARPHGALFVVVAVYAALGGAYLLLWLIAPTAAFVGFVLLTWVHWGLGDLYGVVAFTGGDHLETRRQRALTAGVRGAIPMLVPLVTHPAEYRAVAALVVGSVDPAAVASLAPAFEPAGRLLVGAGLGVVLTLSLAVGAVRARRPGRGGGFAVDAGETLLLVAFFSLVPPVLAIGLYFPLWHSVRHVLRVQLLDAPSLEGFRTGRLAPAAARFGRDAVVMTAGALVVFGGVYAVVPAATLSLEGAVGVYLVLLAVLTLPHAVLAAWADRRQGVWATPS